MAPLKSKGFRVMRASPRGLSPLLRLPWLSSDSSYAAAVGLPQPCQWRSPSPALRPPAGRRDETAVEAGAVDALVGAMGAAAKM